MVRDGIFYGAGLLAVGVVVAWLTQPWWAAVPVLLALFFLWFFRDPHRAIPVEAGAVVSPADGKVTSIAAMQWEGRVCTRVSIFLNVFDVHVNRSPVEGVIRKIEYRKGSFGNAMDPVSSEANEQNTVTIEGEGHTFVMKQIAGLLARRIVFSKHVGESVGRGERVGLIKFGSRTDLIMPRDAQVAVGVGEQVRGGASLIARLPQSSAGSAH